MSDVKTTVTESPAFNEGTRTAALKVSVVVGVGLAIVYLVLSQRDGIKQADLTVALAMSVGIVTICLGCALLVIEASYAETTTKRPEQVTATGTDVDKVAEAISKVLESFARLNGSKAALAVGTHIGCFATRSALNAIGCSRGDTPRAMIDRFEENRLLFEIAAMIKYRRSTNPNVSSLMIEDADLKLLEPARRDAAPRTPASAAAPRQARRRPAHPR